MYTGIVHFTDHNLLVVRNRSKSVRHQSQINVNFLPLSNAEVDLLRQLSEERSTDWLFASERKQRLSERSLHHLIQQAGVRADLPVSIHPYMLRRSGIYFRAALLLQGLDWKVGIIRPEGIETFGWISKNYEMIRSPLGAVWIRISTDGDLNKIPVEQIFSIPVVFDPELGSGTIDQLEERLAEKIEATEDFQELNENGEV